ncbi:MAG: hypothetical protein HRT81_12825 [Henriciella sp.]|nr:hypothetical protein [Henriciella sp.]
MTALNTYSTARAYAQSAFAMMIGDARISLQNDLTFFLSFHLLIGFSMELYLKTVLLHQGVSEKTLKSFEFRHNLRNLYEEAKSKGFYATDCEVLVSYLHEKHKAHEFRYMKDDASYDAMRLDYVFDILSAVDVAVDKLIGARALHGLDSDGAWNFPTDRAMWRYS